MVTDVIAAFLVACCCGLKQAGVSAGQRASLCLGQDVGHLAFPKLEEERYNTAVIVMETGLLMD